VAAGDGGGAAAGPHGGGGGGLQRLQAIRDCRAGAPGCANGTGSPSLVFVFLFLVGVTCELLRRGALCGFLSTNRYCLGVTAGLPAQFSFLIIEKVHTNK
jgi:hypothetical protein